MTSGQQDDQEKAKVKASQKRYCERYVVRSVLLWLPCKGTALVGAEGFVREACSLLTQALSHSIGGGQLGHAGR